MDEISVDFSSEDAYNVAKLGDSTDLLSGPCPAATALTTTAEPMLGTKGAETASSPMNLLRKCRRHWDFSLIKMVLQKCVFILYISPWENSLPLPSLTCYTDLLFGFLHCLVLLVHLLHGRAHHKDSQGQLHWRIGTCSTLWMESSFTAGSGYNPGLLDKLLENGQIRELGHYYAKQCIVFKLVNKRPAIEFVPKTL